ncbi:MAG: YncE family protein [Nitrospirae bacterium]|nr:YncE family protein [Nitrospirota bacterium]
MKKRLKRNGVMVQAAASLSLILMGCALSTLTASPAPHTPDDPGEAAWADIPEGFMRVVVSPDDARLYLLRDSEPQSGLLILDAATARPLHRIPVGRKPIAMAMDGEIGYVVNYLSDDVTVVNLKTPEAVKTIPVGHRPIRAATSARTPYLFVTNYGSDTLSVIDKNTLKVLKTLSLGGRPADMAIHPEGRYAYVLHRGTGDLSVVEIASFEVIRKASVGEFPTDVAVSEDGQLLFVSDAHVGTLNVVRTDDLKVIRKIRIGERPMEVLTVAGGPIYVLNNQSQSISVVDPAKQEAVVTIPLKYSPRCMTTTSDGGRLYVSYGERYGEITVVEMAGQKVVRSTSSPVVSMER